MIRPTASGLTVQDLSVRYGRVQAVSGVSFSVADGESLGIIGANGAGKSSTLKAIFRLIDSTAASMHFAGASLQATQPHHVVSLGMSYVPEGRHVFAGLSVRKNLMMGAYRSSWRHLGDRIERVYELFPALKKFDGVLAGALSGGQQQMLAIGRALLSEPKLLVLDEPSMGLAPVLIDDIAATLRRLRGEGVGMLLVEQNAKLTFALTDRCIVLENGRVVKEGPSAVLRADPAVRQIYLGL